MTMSDPINDAFLWGIVAWPLLLAIPALYSRLPLPRYLAILPAAVLVFLPGETARMLPWLFFGTGLAVDGESRWILLMSVILWLAAVAISHASQRNLVHHHATPFFLLTLAGSLGTVLATDLVGFFVFSTIMGYSFYGLLVQDGDEGAHRAGRLYLIVLVVADLALFEALLMAAFATEDLRFEAVRQTMVGSDSAIFFVALVSAGFALKVGAWPFYGWLAAGFASSSRATAVLLCSIPVTMGLLGAVRWLPLGQSSFYVSGTVLQFWGGMAMLYAVLRLFGSPSPRLVPAWAIVMTTGGGIVLLGVGLSYPALWREYGELIYPLIALLGVLLASLTFTIGRLKKSDGTPAQVDVLIWAARRIFLLQSWITAGKLGGLRLGEIWLRRRCTTSLQYIRRRENLLCTAEHRLRRWSVIITLLSLFGFAVALSALI